MNPIEIILGLFAAVAALAYLATRLRVPYPIFLVLGGLALGFWPHLPRVALAPDVVFLVFLPPILYYAGAQTSWRDFKANRRPIALLAVGLVLFTTALVAVAAHYLIGMSWPAAFVLGAIVSPPDAVAATAIMSRMRIPKRIITILEGESLVNDATAIVAYRLAIGAVSAAGAFSLGEASLRLVLVAVGGVAVGLAVGFAVAFVRKRVHEDNVDAMVSLLTPYFAYLPAEHLHVSGVLAAVAAGVYMSRRLPQITTSHGRIRLYAVWDVFLFILNGLVFILIGLQLPAILERLRAQSVTNLVRDAALLSGIVVLLRIVWVFPSAYVPRWLFPSIRRTDPTPPFASLFMISWTGMRGIVSLAAALALPLTTAAGADFPHRDLIIFLTFGVILSTLVVQGLTLPLVIRLLKLADDGTEQREELRARYEGVQAAIARLEVLIINDEAREDLVSPIRAEYQRSAAALRRELGIRPGVDDEEAAVCRTRMDVRLRALEAQHRMLIRLRDEDVIGDDVLRRVQADLDLEEARLAENGNGGHKR
jgi:CPA1 family monovalent cation:H+ antiporter